MDYYNKAINLFPKKMTYYVMSDDLEWCKKNFINSLDEQREFVFLNIKDDLEALLVITLFQNYIIANSTFHWWGSYLSLYPNPKIIAPDKWLNEKGYESIYTDEMFIINRIIEI